jgi:hypothetical protein
MGGFFISKNMKFCKETERGICNPFYCHLPNCSVGENARELLKNAKCKSECVLFNKELNEVNPCKDAWCPITDLIIARLKKESGPHNSYSVDVLPNVEIRVKLGNPETEKAFKQSALRKIFADKISV